MQFPQTRLGAVAVVVAALSACASRPDLIDQRLASTPPEKVAYAIGTYTTTCEPHKGQCIQVFDEIALSYRSADKGTARSIKSISGSMLREDTVYDFVDQERRERGFHFCIPLPPGDYGFFAFNVYNYAGGGSGQWIGEKNLFDLPFSLSPGEVVYVGRLKVTTTEKPNLLGIKIPALGVLLLSSEDAAAQRAALGKCPKHVQTRSIRDASVRPSMARGNPLVQADESR